jgi:Tfp pilus assembly protein PilN
MIRINLISEAIPLAHRALVMVACLVGAVGWLFYDYTRTNAELGRVQQEIVVQQAQLARLTLLRREVATFDQQKATIDHRIQVISQLEADRRESQQLLDSIAQTVNGTPSLWLTGVTRKGDSLAIEGRAASINAVARFISELRRSGRFARIEIKSTEQQPNHQVPTFQFTLAADFQTKASAGGGG